MHEAAAELVRMKVDIILASSSAEVEPARRATHTIPIVFVTHADPVGLGHVSSLARPGGNATGLAAVDPDIVPKRLRPPAMTFSLEVNMVGKRCPQRGQARRAASRAGFQVPADHQSQDGQGAGAGDSAVATGAGG